MPMNKRVMRMPGLFAVITILCLTQATHAKPRWHVYENCTLLSDQYYDGDSFHVQCGKNHYVLRLYFVDAPETDNEIKGRLQEQAAYFAIDDTNTLAIGAQAREYSRKFMQGNFTVYSKHEDARGRSRIKRYFAMIKGEEGWLSEALVSEGLVRVYGMPTDLPDGLPARKYVANLKVTERAARRAKRGAWGAEGRK